MRKKAGKSKDVPSEHFEDGIEENPKINLVYLKSEEDKAIGFQGKLRRPHRAFNKSEVIRAGIYALELLTPEQLEEVEGSVPQL